jgi:hypothetical protein
MEGHKSLQLTLTEAELETLITRFAARPVVVFLNLNLSCAQPGEGHSRNLTTLRPPLMLVETNRAAFKGLS